MNATKDLVVNLLEAAICECNSAFRVIRTLWPQSEVSTKRPDSVIDLCDKLGRFKRWVKCEISSIQEGQNLYAVLSLLEASSHYAHIIENKFLRYKNDKPELDQIAGNIKLIQHLCDSALAAMEDHQ